LEANKEVIINIAVISPIIERVPPFMYGGTELIVYNLTEELVRMGFNVDLYSSANSITSANLIAVSQKTLREDLKNQWPYDYFIGQLSAMERAQEHLRQKKYDIVHNHNEYIGLMLEEKIKAPFLTTFHGRLDFNTFSAFCRRHSSPKCGFISISKNQQSQLKNINWVANVYNGIDLNNYPFKENCAKDYVLFLSRIADDKGVIEAIRAAKIAGVKIILASKVDLADADFFKKRVEPLIDGRDVVYLGEVSHEKKVSLYQEALAYLFPIKWPEPFGLTMVESLSCGTPVLAYGFGSVPEIIKDGVNGFISFTPEKMAKDIKRVSSIDRKNCLKSVSKFSKERMATNYLKAYKKIISC
jgi:glycosyltransferase involved in cell wall biosynthesis